MGTELSIIASAYNEDASLEELHRRLTSVVADHAYELILVNDGSTDGTVPLLNALAHHDPRLRVIHFAQHRGKTTALAVAFALADGAAAITLDADLQDLPENIPLLLHRLTADCAMVIGVRRNRQEGFLRILASRCFNLLCSTAFRYPFHDINSGLKAFTRRCYQTLQPHLQGERHRLIPLLAIRQGFRVAEVTVPHARRKHGTTKYPLLRWRGLCDVLLLLSPRTSLPPQPDYRLATVRKAQGISLVNFPVS